MIFFNLLAKIINIINNYVNIIYGASKELILQDYICIKTIIESKLNCMKKLAKISLIVFTGIALIVLLLIGGFFVYINTAKSDVEFNKELLQEANSTINIYDVNNNRINKESGKKALITYDEIPGYVVDAFVSIEDKDFYNHKGLNYKRMAKAVVKNIASRSFKEGASTISQQLIKNTHLSSEKTIARKLNEMALAIELEKNFTKDEIMETYLNVIYFGNGAYGLENASKQYFNKTATELTLTESALLAGMIKSPKTYSPIYNNDKALKRRNLVLSEMKKDGKISQKEYEMAINQPIILSSIVHQKNTTNFYEEAVILEAEKVLNLSEKELALGEYKIFTYQNPTDQNALKNCITNTNYYEQNSYGNIADGCGIIIDNNTGGITAFDGKSNYDIINMKRSPGSSIKPILVYAPALESGKISPSTPILDEKTTFSGYSPQNVGGIYYGWIDANKSVEKSLNIPAIKIMQVMGIDKCKKMAENCGIKFDINDNNYAIALGGLTNGTSVIELVNSYLPFANGGNFIEAKFIKKICDKNGNVIYENNQNLNNVMSEETAYLMTEMLQNSVKNGTSSRLNKLGFDVAGKTGTVGIKGTNYNSDVWSVAYTPQKTVGVWLGNSTGDKEFMLEGSNNGGTYCTSIVRDTINNIDIDKSIVFDRPSNIVTVNLDIPSLEKTHTLAVAHENTPDRYKLKANFNKKYAPTKVAEAFSTINICKINVITENNKPKIEFDAIKLGKYKLYRIEEDERKLIKEFENVSGKQQFIDNSINSDTPYIYYIELHLKNEEKVIKSNSVKITTAPTTRDNLKKIFNFW